MNDRRKRHDHEIRGVVDCVSITELGSCTTRKVVKAMTVEDSPTFDICACTTSRSSEVLSYQVLSYVCPNSQGALEEAKRRDLEMLVANADVRATLPDGTLGHMPGRYAAAGFGFRV